MRLDWECLGVVAWRATDDADNDERFGVPSRERRRKTRANVATINASNPIEAQRGARGAYHYLDNWIIYLIPLLSVALKGSYSTYWRCAIAGGFCQFLSKSGPERISSMFI